MHDKHGKHHRMGEHEHHKMREKHKSHHHSKKSQEYSHHPHMMDDRMLHDTHQQGIERVKQRPGDMEVGQHGKMGRHHEHGDSFKRNSGDSLTPRKG